MIYVYFSYLRAKDFNKYPKKKWSYLIAGGQLKRGRRNVNKCQDCFHSTDKMSNELEVDTDCPPQTTSSAGKIK